MNILFSAYECNPNLGSDAYVGWSWALNMSKLENVHILTHSRNKNDIENYLNNKSINVTFHYIDTNSKINRILGKRLGYFWDYVVWQKYAYKYSKKLCNLIKFDIIHHVSIADFRVVGKLWKLGIPFIFGPVGGGQETPKVMKKYIKRYILKEKFRKAINIYFMRSYNYRKALINSKKIFVSNDETIEVIKKHNSKKIELVKMCELGIDNDYIINNENVIHINNEVIHILVAGRLMYRKGIEFLLDSIEKIKTQKKFIVDIYGNGPQKKDIEKWIIEKKLSNIVMIHDVIPHNQMKEIFKNADILAFPSLRETTGTTIIEAMANKLPIVALNQNGVKYLVENDAGILVDLDGNCEEVADRFANSLVKLIENYELRVEMGKNGFNKLKKSYTWNAITKKMQKDYENLVYR